MGRILFITGTDTGVGKTVATALLLCHLRQSGVRALAMKPFCSGDRGDVEVLQGLQAGVLADDEMNPYFFRLPLAPLVAARREGRQIGLKEVLQRIGEVSQRCDRLLIEGCGGLLSPLGEGFTLAEVIAKMGGDVLVVAPNKVGVVNQVCLTVKALPESNTNRWMVVLMGQKRADLSAESNAGLLGELLGKGRKAESGNIRGGQGGIQVFQVPLLACKSLRAKEMQKVSKKIKKCLQALVGKIP